MKLKSALNKFESISSNFFAFTTTSLLTAFLVSLLITFLSFDTLLAFSCNSFSRDLTSDRTNKLSSVAKTNLLCSKYGISWILVVNKDSKIVHSYYDSKIKDINKALLKNSGFAYLDENRYYDSVNVVDDNSSMHVGYIANDFFDCWNIFSPYVIRLNILVFASFLFISIFIAMLFYQHKILAEMLESAQSKTEELRKFVDSETGRVRLQADSEKLELKEKYEKEIIDLKSKMAEFKYQKNINSFVKLLNDELANNTSFSKVCSKIVNSLRDLFAEYYLASLLINLNGQKLKPLAFTGFEDGTEFDFRNIPLDKILSAIKYSGSNTLTLNNHEFEIYSFDQVFNSSRFSKIFVFGIEFQNELIGLYLILQENKNKNLSDNDINLLVELMSDIGVCITQISRFQQQFEDARTDLTTKVCNNKYLYEVIPYINQRIQLNINKNNCSLILIEIKDILTITKEFGQKTSDEILQVVTQIIRNHITTTVPIDEEAMKNISGNHIIRQGNDRILLILENTNILASMHLAKQINEACISKSVTWPKNIHTITLAIGAVTSPENGQSVEDLLVNVDKALFYANENLNQNNIVHLMRVKDIKVESISNGNFEGDLTLMNPSALLQSVEISFKTGVLTVASLDNRKISISFEKGAPVLAKLNDIKGKDAIVEFVTSFTNGKFLFQEQQKVKTGTILRLQNLDKECLIEKPLTSILMEAALAQDNLNWAKNILSNVGLNQVVNISDGFRLFTIIGQNPEYTNKIDKESLRTVIEKLANKVTPIEILKYDEIPTHKKWLSLAIIYQVMTSAKVN